MFANFLTTSVRQQGAYAVRIRKPGSFPASYPQHKFTQITDTRKYFLSYARLIEFITGKAEDISMYKCFCHCFRL
jgi:hypothetical protein